MFVSGGGEGKSFWDFLKNIFLLLVLGQFLFAFFPLAVDFLKEKSNPKLRVAWLEIGGMISNSRDYLGQIRNISNDDSIKAVLLKMDSPGGSPGPSELLFRELLELREKKPIFALVEGQCASGGYYIASAANKVFAQEASIVGGIGVFLIAPKVKDLATSLKVDYELYSKGDYKLVLNPLSDKTNEKNAKYVQLLCDEQYLSFVENVSAARGLRKNDHKVWADGRIFSGRQARDLNLIDGIASLSDVEREIKTYLNEESNRVVSFVGKRPESFLKKALGFSNLDDSIPAGHQSFSLTSFFLACINAFKIALVQEACVQ